MTRAGTSGSKPTRNQRLELWGGLECTVNRVGDRWSDQNLFNGHGERGILDLERFESLEIPRMRYPVLWEHIAPDSPSDMDFSGADGRMEYLRESRLDPIVGLLHHGSGPQYTSLVDPAFPEEFARFAGHVARRYPWVRYYTPINEPLTTARFSGLYGVWYPHGRDDVTFSRALYSEVQATVLAMRAIREINPDAQLVQTDDLGRATGTRVTAEQVAFENERRWLGFDLLMGRVDKEHPLYRYLVDKGGITENELAWLTDNPCPPDIVGINHYPLSNRFLDHEMHWYPHGVRVASTDWCSVDYADVPAVESGRAESPSVEDVLRDVWERYPTTPFAVTEVHINGDSDTQLQWLWEVWTAARRLHREGALVEAVTVWGLLGNYDWNTLCTTPVGEPVLYEPGVFDVSDGTPRPTELATMVRAIARNGSYDHPALMRHGYWRDQSRLRFALGTTALENANLADLSATDEELAS
jgi:dTDP-4-dehydrorhamnose reductase